MTSKLIPALSGSQGPGDIMIPSGSSSSASLAVILSLRTTRTVSYTHLRAHET